MSFMVPAPCVSVSLQRLAAAFATVPDPRRAASVRYPLPAILAMTVAAILSNHVSVLAISEWAARQPDTTLAALGFPTDQTPCQSTLQRLFAKLDGTALEQMVATAIAPVAVPAADTLQGVAIDGKAQRGRLRFPAAGGPVHALSAYCHEAGLVLAQEPIDAPAGTDRGEAELAAAPALLARLDWQGRVLTGDALFCQRDLCQQGRLPRRRQDQPAGAARRHPVPVRPVRGCGDAAAAGPAWGPDAGLWPRAGPGPAAAGRLDRSGRLPGLARRHAQVLRIERTWREQDVHKRAVSYAITSLAPERADSTQLLALKRGHWAIENGLHRCKGVNLGEDASLIHAGQGPQVMALLRDAAVSLLHAAGVRRIAARLRHHSQHPDQAVALVLGAFTTHA